ncbi:hypothetical protein [Phosphitispora fastidiosa]|uniref:hypothetical protein n=1 Tax=Phosphitispora fastidiosa TaxID=2837202 RepID=UPI001E3DC8EC|nr:hypothetical protein [Phosphitispora fastidiosa]MBU7006898.1 hypothetical protein [Phosphitispora fastidiosa]
MSERERGKKFPWLTNCGGRRATGIPTVAAKFESRFRNKGEGKMIFVRNGEGVTTALIKKHNIAVYSEKQISEELLKKLLVDS